MSVIDSKIPNGATSWDGYKGSRVEEYIKERFTKVEEAVADAVLAGDDAGEVPGSYTPSSAEEATYAHRWKSASGAAVDGKTEGSMVELYNMAKQGGPQGPEGPQGPVGPQGPRGPQGNTGSSVDYPYELVNNLDTDDATKALSAAMGAYLKSMFAPFFEEGIADTDSVSSTTGYLAATTIGQKVTVNSGATLKISAAIPVTAGMVCKMKSQGTGIAAIAWGATENGDYYAKAISSVSSGEQNHQWVVDQDGYVKFSSRAAVYSGKVVNPSERDIEADAVNWDKIPGLAEKMAEIYPLLIKGDAIATEIQDQFSWTRGQGYGTVGSIVQFDDSGSAKYLHARIPKSSGASRVSIYVPSQSGASSLIQYVDDNDTVIALSATSGTYTQGSYNEYDLSFPSGATAVYVSSQQGYPAVVWVIEGEERYDIIGDFEELYEPAKTLVSAINKASRYEDIASKLWARQAQAYGSVGSAVTFFNSELWRCAKIDLSIYKLSSVVIAKPSNSSPSSLIQYVDENDIILEVDGVYPSQGYHQYKIKEVQGAAGVYISWGPDFTPVVTAKPLASGSGSSAAPFRFRYLSWNIGHYAKGNASESRITSETYEQAKRDFRTLLHNQAADVCGICEFSSIFYPTTQETAKDAIFAQYKYSEEGIRTGGYEGIAFFGGFPMADKQEWTWGSLRNMSVRINAGGKSIILCEVHIPWNDRTAHANAIAYVLDKFKDEPYVVIAGDFNLYADEEMDDLQLFIDEGYQVANWGYMGKILTSYNNIINSNYLDNIAVKGGSIVHTQVVQNTPEGKDPDNPDPADESAWDAVNLSDHFPIISDIVF